MVGDVEEEPFVAPRRWASSATESATHQPGDAPGRSAADRSACRALRCACSTESDLTMFAMSSACELASVAGMSVSSERVPWMIWPHNSRACHQRL